MNKVGRLAFRVEGTMWNAYYALPDTMERAILLGSIRMVFVADNPERKNAFFTLMREAMADHLEQFMGARPDMVAEPAPEHERGGNA